MKAELKFNKIKHFLDKRDFKYEEMHEKNRTATFSTCRNTNYASSFCQEKTFPLSRKSKSLMS